MAPLNDDDGNSGGGIPVKTRMKRILFTRKKSIKIGNAVNFSRCTICTKLHLEGVPTLCLLSLYLG